MKRAVTWHACAWWEVEAGDSRATHESTILTLADGYLSNVVRAAFAVQVIGGSDARMVLADQGNFEAYAVAIGVGNALAELDGVVMDESGVARPDDVAEVFDRVKSQPEHLGLVERGLLEVVRFDGAKLSVHRRLCLGVLLVCGWAPVDRYRRAVGEAFRLSGPSVEDDGSPETHHHQHE